MEKTKKLAVGILAHVDAGKTTLAEGILYKTGQIRKAGRVDHKDAFLDTEELEKARGITIFSKQAVLKLMWISRRRWSALYRSWTMRFF